MRVFRHTADIPADLHGAVLAVGNFDGVHLGHQALIAHARETARRIGAPLAILSFEPHPRRYFQPGAPPFRLTPLRIKARLFASLGVDAFFAVPFDAALAALTAEGFVNTILAGALRVAHVVIGEDFQFGKGRSGNAEILKALGAANGFGVDVFGPVSQGGARISSSAIRAALAEGRPRDAAALMGRPFAIEARVQHGDARGRTIGFPTANMHLDDSLAPRFGVYAVRARTTGDNAEGAAHDGPVYDGVSNFGIRPMYPSAEPLLETYLFDFSGDLYGRHLMVELVEYLRPEMRLDGLSALKARIEADCAAAKAALAA